VSNFSCTLDAFTHAMLAFEMGSKPYLILEIDAHTADAGIQTRLEAFLDIVRNYREGQTSRTIPFTACRLNSAGRVVRSDGEELPLTDPRVRIYFPNFSHFHAQAIAMAARWLGLQTGEVLPLDRAQLDRGLQYTSGRECLPLPICLGQLLDVHERSPAGEIAGFFMLRGGAPCVVDCYMGYFERFLAEQRLADVFLLSPQPENNYCGFSETALTQNLSAVIPVADILVEIEHVLRVVGADGSVDELRPSGSGSRARLDRSNGFKGTARLYRSLGGTAAHARSSPLSQGRGWPAIFSPALIRSYGRRRSFIPSMASFSSQSI
jgi:hypothetical protein